MKYWIYIDQNCNTSKALSQPKLFIILLRWQLIERLCGVLYSHNILLGHHVRVLSVSGTQWAVLNVTSRHLPCAKPCFNCDVTELTVHAGQIVLKPRFIHKKILWSRDRCPLSYQSTAWEHDSVLLMKRWMTDSYLCGWNTGFKYVLFPYMVSL